MAIRKYCKRCGRRCETQQGEDYELCPYHLKSKIDEDLGKAVSGISTML